MIISCDPTAGSLRMRERDVFTSFHVEAPESTEPAAISRLLATPAPDREDHVWVSIAQLRELAGETSEEWEQNLDAMLAYAESKGWLSDGGDLLLAHIETGS